MSRAFAGRYHLHWLVLGALTLGIGAPSCSKKRGPFGGGLPASVTDVHEEDIDMFPDWEYYFRATMPNADCEALLAAVVAKEKLHFITEHDWLDGRGDWSPGKPPAWWKPSYAGGHHHGRSGDINICAMCRSGMFYYWTGSH